MPATTAYTVRLETIPPRRVAFIRHVGPYRSVEPAFQRGDWKDYLHRIRGKLPNLRRVAELLAAAGRWLWRSSRCRRSTC